MLPETVREIRYVDLFCGLGAFHTAFDRNNQRNPDIHYRCVFACDIDKSARLIYEENYGLRPAGDINKIIPSDIPNMDILCAGFPCQPFSIAGKQKGFSDENKGNLFYKILEIIDAKRPSTIILENVKNLKPIHNGETFNKIKTEIKRRGYTFSYKILDSKDYNSPQSRKRIFIVCDLNKKHRFAEIKNPVVPVESILDPSVTSYFNYEDKFRVEKSGGNGMMKYKLINKKTGKGGRQGERVYGVSSYGPTICASSGGPGAKTGLYEINGKFRTLNVKEALQMFGFDTSYKYNSFCSDKKMLFYLGNSIVVNVLEEVIKYL